MKLTTEQEFFLQAVKAQIKGLPREQLEKEFIDMLEGAIKKEAFFKAMMLESAGIL
jgi:hypothetical protein